MAKTVIHQDLKSYFGDKDHFGVSQSRSFSSLVFELLCEREPSEKELKLFELILNLSIDHGPDTPSAKEVIREKGKGKSISKAVASGISQIDEVHGGAIEPAMEMLYRIKNEELRIENFVKECLDQGKKIAGFGHRIYKDIDPRAELILSKLKENGLGEEYIKIARDMEAELLKQKGVKLPLNIDGAIAVVLCSFSWPSRLGKAVFIIARTPGLCGQYFNSSI